MRRGPSSEQEQAEFFGRVRDGFVAAASVTGEVVRHFRVAGTRVRLRFAGSALVPMLTPGLAHPITVDEFGRGPGFLDICLWDSASTGVEPVPPPRGLEDLTGRGIIWGFDSARYRSAYQWGEGSVSVMDRETHEAVYWVPSHEQLPAWVLSSPLRSILHWWLEQNGRQLVHGAAVGHAGRGVLIPGRGGAGKSSTALACLMGGLDYLSDDYVAVAMEPEPRIYQLYSTAKLDTESLALYPGVEKRCRSAFGPGFEKTVLFLGESQMYRRQLRESLRMSLVLQPRVSGLSDTTVGSAEAWEIEQGLAAETLAHLPHTGAHTAALLERISLEVPRATVHLGTERGQIARVIGEFVGGLGKSTPVGPLPRIASLPHITIVAHLREGELDGLRALAQSIEEQEYRRV